MTQLDVRLIRERRQQRSCGRCAHLAKDGLLCDHYAKADAENAEVGVRDPNATDGSITLGEEIIDWDDSDADSGCPGFET